jgi:hypothetical protein
MRKVIIAACLGLVVGVVLTVAAVVLNQRRELERRVFAFGMSASQIQPGDTEASVRARFGRPQDIVDGKAEADRLASQCRDRAAARQLTYEADVSCVHLFGTPPPQYLLFVCLNDARRVIRADTTIMYFAAEHSR